MNLKKVVMTMMVCWMAISVHAQWENSLKVVVSDNGLLVGRYVRQTDSTYIANPVDWEEEVPKKGFRVEVWTPEKGKGFVGRKANAFLERRVYSEEARGDIFEETEHALHSV